MNFLLKGKGAFQEEQQVHRRTDRLRPETKRGGKHCSDSGAQQKKVLQSTLAGCVSVNETLMHIAQDGLPFGGVGPSCMGHYHGKFGFDTPSKLKPVIRQSRINGLGLFSPPYGAFFSQVIRFMWGHTARNPSQYLDSHLTL